MRRSPLDLRMVAVAVAALRARGAELRRSRRRATSPVTAAAGGDAGQQQIAGLPAAGRRAVAVDAGDPLRMRAMLESRVREPPPSDLGPDHPGYGDGIDVDLVALVTGDAVDVALGLEH